MKKRFPILSLCCLLGLGLVRMVIISGAADVQQEEATPIQVGTMTEKQRAHSKLFDSYKTNRKLDALPLPSQNDKDLERGVYIEPGTPVTSPDVAALSFGDFLKERACASDAVAIVNVKNKSSQLTENREFIFTDYTAVVQQVFKDNALSPMRVGATITVTRPGGKVKINGQVINAVDSSFKLLQQERLYLLFLKYIPGIDVYQSIRKGSFRLEDSKLISLTEEFLPGGSDDARPFTIDVRKALTSGCFK